MPPRAATAASRGIGALSLTERIGAYAELSKFGIVLLVLVSAGAGFMLRAPLGPEFPWRVEEKQQRSLPTVGASTRGEQELHEGLPIKRGVNQRAPTSGIRTSHIHMLRYAI